MVLDMLNNPWAGLKPSRNWLIHHGDPTESIFYNENRYDQGSHSFRDTMFSQVESVVSEFKSSRRRFLFMLDGNHGSCHRVRPYGNPTLEICNQLDIPFGTYAAIATYSLGSEVQFRHYAGHGWGNVSSRVKPYKRALANMEIQLRALLEHKSSNCMLMSMGHTHKLVTYRPECHLYMCSRDNKIDARWTSNNGYYGDIDFIPGELRWYVNTGSMLKLTRLYESDLGVMQPARFSNVGHVSGYAEMFGYDPVPIGFCIAEVRDGKIRDIKKLAIDSKAGVTIID